MITKIEQVANFLLNNLEIIKNILLSLVAVFFIVIGFIIFIKIYCIVKQIKDINKEIEEKQIELNNDEIDGMGLIDFDFLGNRQKYRRSLEQEIERSQEKKKCLLEEISIYKIFKK